MDSLLKIYEACKTNNADKITPDNIQTMMANEILHQGTNLTGEQKSDLLKLIFLDDPIYQTFKKQVFEKESDAKKDNDADAFKEIKEIMSEAHAKLINVKNKVHQNKPDTPEILALLDKKNLLLRQIDELKSIGLKTDDTINDLTKLITSIDTKITNLRDNATLRAIDELLKRIPSSSTCDKHIFTNIDRTTKEFKEDYDVAMAYLTKEKCSFVQDSDGNIINIIKSELNSKYSTELINLIKHYDLKALKGSGDYWKMSMFMYYLGFEIDIDDDSKWIRTHDTLYRYYKPVINNITVYSYVPYWCLN